MKLIFWGIVVLLGMLGTRASLIAMRGGAVTRSLVLSLLGLIGTFGTIALLIWGFFQFPWYWPVAIFICGSVIQAVVISRSNLPFWLTLAPILDLVVLVGGIYLVGFAR